MNKIKALILFLFMFVGFANSQVQDVYKNYAYDNYTHWVGRSANKLSQFEPSMVQLANYYCIYLIANYNSDTATADSARTIINDIWNTNYTSSQIPFFPNFNTLFSDVLDSISNDVIDSLVTAGFATTDTLQYYVLITVFEDSLADIRTDLSGVQTSLGSYTALSVFLDSLSDIRGDMLLASDVGTQINDSLTNHDYYEGARILDSIDARITLFRDTTTLTSGGGIDLDGVADGQILYNNGGSLGTDAKFLFTGSTRTAGAFYNGINTPNGTDTIKWNGRFFATNLYAANALTVSGTATINTATISATLNSNGTTNLGNGATDTTFITGEALLNNYLVLTMQDTLPGNLIATKAEVNAINVSLDSVTFDTIGIVLDVDLTGGAVTSVNTGQSVALPKVISIQDTSHNELIDEVFVQGYELITNWYIKIYSTTAYDSLTIYYIKDDAGTNPGGNITGSGVAGQMAIFDGTSSITGSDTLDYYYVGTRVIDSIESKIIQYNDSSNYGNITSSQVQDLSTQNNKGIFFEQGDSLATDQYKVIDNIYFDALNNGAYGISNFGAITTGQENIIAGNVSGTGITSGSYNVGMGKNVFTTLVTGDNNIGIGEDVFGTNISGNYNVGIGYTVNYAGMSGSNNVSIGVGAMGSTFVTGSNNIGLGYFAFSALTGGDYNVGIGENTLNSLTTSQYNTAYGYYSGYSYDNDNGIFIGANAGRYYQENSNVLIINSLNRSTENGDTINSIIHGRQAVSSSDQKLDLNANVKVKHNLTMTNVQTDTSDYKLGLDANNNVVRLDQAHGTIYLDSNTVAETFASSGVWYPVNNWTVGDVFDQLTFSNDTLYIQITGTYKIDFSGYSAISGAAGNDYSIGMSVNSGLPLIPTRARRNVTSTNYGDFHGWSVMLRLQAGDALVMKVNNRTGTNTITLLYGSMTINKIN